MDTKLVNLLKTEPVKIANLLGFDKMGDLHNDWMKKMLYSKEDYTLLGHRSSYKSTALSVSIALLTILKPRENIIFLRKTDEDVIEIIRQVKNILETPLMANIVKRIYGVDFILNSSSSYKIDSNLNTSTKGAVQVLGIGTSSSLTGKHAQTIFTDDICNVKDRISKAERERIKLVYMELQNIKNRGGRIINTATPWHKEDAISLMPNVQRYDCYSTGLITREKLEELRESMTDSLFAANYELKHIADKDAIFTDPKFTTEMNRIYNGIAHIDASYGGADGTAFTIIAKYKNGYIGLGKRWNKHVDDCLDEILSLCKQYRAGTIYCERNADKGYLAKEIESKKYPVRTYHEKTNKFIKITTYLKSEWNNIEWLEDTDSDYINEILDYTEFAEHDDAPDSAASILRAINSRATFSFE